MILIISVSYQTAKLNKTHPAKPQVSPTNITAVTTPIKQIKLSGATLCAISKRFTKPGAPKPAFQMVFPYLERVFALNKQINGFWCDVIYKDFPWLKGE